MRITNNMMVNSTVRNINSSANRLNKAQEQMSSQNKIQLPSDDPIIATRSIKYRNYVAQVEQYQKNVDDVSSWQEVTDSALQDLSDVIEQLRTLTVQASSDTLTDDERSDIKTEVEELQNQAIDIMNTSIGGRYIFAGYDTDEAPYQLITSLNAEPATTNTTGYAGDGSDFSSVAGLEEGNYTLTTIASTTGSGYDVTLTDESGEIVALANSVDPTAAGGIMLEGKDGVSVHLASSPTVNDGGSMNFAFSEAVGDTVLYKGQYLSPGGVISNDVDDSTIEDFMQNNADDKYVSGSDQSIRYNIGFNSENVVVNTEGQAVIGEGDDNLFNAIAKLMLALDGETSYKTAVLNSDGTVSITEEPIGDIDNLLTDLDNDAARLQTAQAALGARMNYVNDASDSLDSNYATYTELLVNNENVDTAEASTNVSTAEYVYQASLSVGAKAITASLVDYIG